MYQELPEVIPVWRKSRGITKEQVYNAILTVAHVWFALVVAYGVYTLYALSNIQY